MEKSLHCEDTNSRHIFLGVCFSHLNDFLATSSPYNSVHADYAFPTLVIPAYLILFYCVPDRFIRVRISSHIFRSSLSYLLPLPVDFVLLWSYREPDRSCTLGLAIETARCAGIPTSVAVWIPRRRYASFASFKLASLNKHIMFADVLAR